MGQPKTVWKLIGRKPYAALAASLLFVLQAALGVAEVLVLERFIDGFSGFAWIRSLMFAAALSGIYAFYYIQGPLLDYLKNRICLQVRAHLDREIIRKAARIAPEALEDKENQALLKRLQDKPEKRYADGFFAVLQILGGALGVAGIFGLLLNNVPFFPIVLLLLLGMMAAAFRLVGKSRVAMYRSRQEIGRRGDYLSGLLFERRLAQEKKLFAYTPYIQALYEEENIRSGRKMLGSVFFVNAVLWLYDNMTYLFSASAYLLLLQPLCAGKIHIGLYIAIIPALTRLGAFFVAAGSSYLPTYQEYRACLADMRKFYALPDQWYDRRSAAPGVGGRMFRAIRGENIVFGYPGQEKPVLDGLSFTFEAGKNYALVGENGCGKTTLIKLLMGFYRPQSGRITIDGRDIQEMEFGELQHFFSAVFQDANRYEYTIEENIRISDLARAGDLETERAAQEAGMDSWILSCADAYDTKLGQLEDGGIDLSGGQWQRLSIARMLYRRAGIYIWDEPTAAMDPLAESRLYTDFLQKRAEDCINIFVTHRLGAAVHADEICVLGNGRFAEQGSHAELMQHADGLYCRMFQAQKGMYE